MEPIRTVSGVAAPLLRDNIDTDTISPGQRRSQVGKPRKLLYTPEELAALMFAAWRYDENDDENPDFVLNRPPFRQARFLLTGRNFGCGSSRETAAEMFRHFGIRCIIAESFAEIFYGNCFKNAVAPVILPAATIRRMAALVARTEGAAVFSLDLERRTIGFGAPGDPPEEIGFDMPELRRRQLLEGIDEIAMTLSMSTEIDRYQAEAARRRPWVLNPGPGDAPPPG